MRRGGLLLVWLVACSATESPTFGNNEEAGSSGNASGGDGGSDGGAPSNGGAPATTTTTSSGDGGSGNAGLEGGAPPCAQGAIVCEGNVAKICDGTGSFSSETDCGAQQCVPNVGCAMCEPGSATCSGDVSTVCNNDGLGTTQYTCDPIQGIVCDPGTGKCTGDCTPEKLETSYIGCDYYPTLTNNSLVNQSQFDYAVAVANTTAQIAEVTVHQGSVEITTATVQPDSVQVITLPWVTSLSQSTITQKVVDGAYRLRSTKPVTVYQYNPLQYSDGSFGYTYTNDASLLLPVNAWTGNYRVAARNTWTYFGSPYAGLYAVTASQDATTVTVTPSPTGGYVQAGAGLAANGTGTVTLDAGDVVQVFSVAGGGNPDIADLTGTLIAADKPVQVIGGHMCTFVPYSVGYCDHLEESMPPLETLADEYIVSAPLISASATKVRMVRVIATQPGTTLSYEPVQPGAPGSIALAGGYIEIPLTQADFRIQASAPVLVSSYMTGQDQGGGTGDPAMAIEVATAQYRNEYLFHAPTNYEANYVNVVIPTGAALTLDGAPVTATFAPVGATGFSVAKVQLSNAGTGNHVISSPLPFGISVYGYGQYTSYWYPGGLDLTPLGL